MPLATLNEWLSRLESLHPRSIDLGLDRVNAVKQILGLDNPPFETVLIGGTNGKGSTATLLANLLSSSGVRTGLFTSPHLLRYNERIWVDRSYASDKEICEAFTEIDAARGEISLTYFEFSALAAAIIFGRHSLECAVLEVGLGGRLDAVNAFDPTLSVITSIDIDHQDWLGQDIESIATEKAGIMRPGVPCLLGPRVKQNSLLNIAADLQVPVLQIGENLQVSHKEQQESWQLKTPTANYNHIPPPSLHGNAQFDNAALAIAAGELLLGKALSDAAIRSMLVDTRLAGRYQIIDEKLRTIFDVAHNVSAAHELVASVRNNGEQDKLVVLLGMYADKDIQGFARELSAVAASWHVLPINSKRAAEPRVVENTLRTIAPNDEITLHSDSEIAIGAARRDASSRGKPLLVTGSFETVGTVLASEIYSSSNNELG